MLIKFFMQTFAVLVYVFANLILGKVLQRWMEKEAKKLEIKQKTEEEVDSFIASIEAVKDTTSLFMYKLCFEAFSAITPYSEKDVTLLIHFLGGFAGTFLFLIMVQWLSKYFKHLKWAIKL